MILGIRSDSMTAALFLCESDGAIIASDTWEAGRSLAKDLLKHIDALITAHSDWSSLSGVVVYRGPGSFTSLRIGITTANTISYAKTTPVIGTDDESWLKKGIARLREGDNDKIVLPKYGSDPHITPPKK